MSTNAVQITKGWRVRGMYMGHPFAGTVRVIEGDQSGYADCRNLVYVYIDNDAAIASDLRNEDGTPWMRRQAGDGLVMLCRNLGGGRLVREDNRYADLRLTRPEPVAALAA